LAEPIRHAGDTLEVPRDGPRFADRLLAAPPIAGQALDMRLTRSQLASQDESRDSGRPKNEQWNFHASARQPRDTQPATT